MKSAPARPKFFNLNKAEKEALRDLQGRRDIIIKPADKGSAVVIMNIADYLAEGYRQLADSNFYRPVSEDLTAEHNSIISDFVATMFLKGEITEKTCDFLVPTKPRMPQLYLLPKIHKPQRPPPGRPIISANDCPTERISQLVDFFLQPFIPDIDSYVRDTSDLLNILDKIGSIPVGSRLVALDVNSLYTNIVNAEAIAAIESILRAK